MIRDRVGVFGQLMIAAVLAAMVSFTLPGIRLVSEWLGEGVVRSLSIILAGVLALKILSIFREKRVCIFLLTLSCLTIYRSLHRGYLDPEWEIKTVWFSYVWLLILTAGLLKRNQPLVFSIIIMVFMSIVILSEDASRIYTMDRTFSHVGKRESLSGITGSYTIYSQCCLITFFLAVSLLLMTKGIVVKLLSSALAITAFISCITSGSRGGALSILFGITFFLTVFILGKSWQSPKQPFWILIIIICLAVIVPWHNVFDAVTSEDIYRGSTSNRWYVYTTGAKLFFDHPIIGIGWREFNRYSHYAPHSGWLQMFVELGLVGGIWEIIVWVMLFRIGFSAREHAIARKDANLAALILCWISIAASFCFWQSITNSCFMLGDRVYYIFSAVILGTYLDRSYNSAFFP